MTSKLFMAGIVVASFGVSAAAVSADDNGGGKRERMSFSQLDADGNGEVSQAELQARAAKRFGDSDSNADGILTREELLAAGQKRSERRVERMLKRFDANGDGALSKDELPMHGADMFARADADNSGGLSEEEFAALRKHGKRPKN